MHGRRSHPLSQAVAAALALVALSGCRDTVEPEHTVELGYDFTVSDQGWETGFADYPAGAEAAMGLVAERRELPASLDTTGEALYLAGTNTSDDLFMYIKRPIGQLRASRGYSVRYRIEIATSAPSDCVGAGGAPGESVYVKAGGSGFEPIAETEDSEPGFLRLNVDKGQQSQGGGHAAVLGDIANGETDCTEPVYRRKVLEGETVTVRSSPDGTLWLLVGTDSGFEGRTGIYFLGAEVFLEG
jgi:hypothetical protein